SGLGDGREHDDVAKHAMIELHGERVLEQVQEPGLRFAEPARNKGAVDQWPGVVAEARVGAGNGTTSQDLEIDERQHDGADPCWGARAGPHHVSLWGPKIEDKPERVAENGGGDTEMGGEPVLANLHTRDEAALDHVPADGTLQAAKHKQACEPGQPVARYVTGGPEANERNEEDDADHSAEEAVAPLPPIDCLELIEAHAPLQLQIFGDPLIGAERLLPGAVRQRGDDAGNGLPFGDREA